MATEERDGRVNQTVASPASDHPREASDLEVALGRPPTELSADEVDAEFLRLGKEQALENNDLRTQWKATFATLGAWALICFALAIDHVAAYIFLLLTAVVLFLMYGLGQNQINARRARLVTEFHAQTGRKPNQPSKPMRPLFEKIIIAIYLALMGYWLTLVALNGGQFYLPNGRRDETRWLWALTLYFGIIAVTVALFGVMMAIIFVIDHFERKRALKCPESESFDPTTGPAFPTLHQPRYPEVVDCLAPYYFFLACVLLEGFGAYYSDWSHLLLIGVLAALVPILRARFRHEKEERQLKLYFDWHKEHRLGEEIDPTLLAKKERHERVQNKYAYSGFHFFLMIFCTTDVIWPKKDKSLTDIDTGSVYFIQASFIICHYFLYRIWREDLRGESGISGETAE